MDKNSKQKNYKKTQNKKIIKKKKKNIEIKIIYKKNKF